MLHPLSPTDTVPFGDMPLAPFAMTKRTESDLARAMADQTCQSYLRGLTEGLFLQQYVQRSGAAACQPDDGPIPVEAAKAAVLNYLAQNPDAVNQEAGAAVILAIVGAHSCDGD